MFKPKHTIVPLCIVANWPLCKYHTPLTFTENWSEHQSHQTKHWQHTCQLLFGSIICIIGTVRFDHFSGLNKPFVPEGHLGWTRPWPGLAFWNVTRTSLFTVKKVSNKSLIMHSFVLCKLVLKITQVWAKFLPNIIILMLFVYRVFTKENCKLKCYHNNHDKVMSSGKVQVWIH